MLYEEKMASVYDAIYLVIKNYCLEALIARRYIESFKQTDGASLLSVACGTGLHDGYLAQWYEVEGIDLSTAQLEVARRRLPMVRYHQGDMRSFDLGREFDVVICLFGSIAYLLTPAEVQQAIAEMAKHLKPGGILLLEPWYQPGDLWPRQTTQSARYSNFTVRRFNRTLFEGNVAKMTMHTYVTRNGVCEELFSEYHELAMYSIEDYMEAFGMAGLDVWNRWFAEPMPDVLVGRKPL
jgi:SAM-dependent methyltransferase